MRAPHLLAAIVLSAAQPALAQVSPRAISVESGLSAPLGRGAGAHAPIALCAALWLEGSVDVVLRLATGVAPRTPSAGEAEWLSGTAGLRWSLAPGPLRPQLFAELGWAQAGVAGRARAVGGAGAGLEWFLARDVALGVAAALRRAPDGAGWRLDGTAGVAAYF